MIYKLSKLLQAERMQTLPSPKEIAKQCEAIRKTWSKAEELKRRTKFFKEK